jgi:hypothetical protein
MSQSEWVSELEAMWESARPDGGGNTSGQGMTDDRSAVPRDQDEQAPTEKSQQGLDKNEQQGNTAGTNGQYILVLILIRIRMGERGGFRLAEEGAASR